MAAFKQGREAMQKVAGGAAFPKVVKKYREEVQPEKQLAKGAKKMRKKQQSVLEKTALG